jgi:hypothetical protein
LRPICETLLQAAGRRPAYALAVRTGDSQMQAASRMQVRAQMQGGMIERAALAAPQTASVVEATDPASTKGRLHLRLKNLKEGNPYSRVEPTFRSRRHIQHASYTSVVRLKSGNDDSRRVKIRIDSVEISDFRNRIRVNSCD